MQELADIAAEIQRGALGGQEWDIALAIWLSSIWKKLDVVAQRPRPSRKTAPARVVADLKMSIIVA